MFHSYVAEHFLDSKFFLHMILWHHMVSNKIKSLNYVDFPHFVHLQKLKSHSNEFYCQSYWQTIIKLSSHWW